MTILNMLVNIVPIQTLIIGPRLSYTFFDQVNVTDRQKHKINYPVPLPMWFKFYFRRHEMPMVKLH